MYKPTANKVKNSPGTTIHWLLTNLVVPRMIDGQSFGTDDESQPAGQKHAGKGDQERRKVKCADHVPHERSNEDSNCQCSTNRHGRMPVVFCHQATDQDAREPNHAANRKVDADR